MHDISRTACPSESADAWTEAEAAAFAHLCEATGSSPGESAFLGDFNGTANAFYFNNEEVQYDGEVFYAPKVATFAIPYSATGVFLDRAEAQRWAMRVALALPVFNIGNMAQFRVSNRGFGAVRMKQFQFTSESEPEWAWEIELHFDVVVRIR